MLDHNTVLYPQKPDGSLHLKGNAEINHVRTTIAEWVANGTHLHARDEVRTLSFSPSNTHV